MCLLPFLSLVSLLVLLHLIPFLLFLPLIRLGLLKTHILPSCLVVEAHSLPLATPTSEAIEEDGSHQLLGLLAMWQSDLLLGGCHGWLLMSCKGLVLLVSSKWLPCDHFGCLPACTHVVEMWLV